MADQTFKAKYVADDAAIDYTPVGAVAAGTIVQRGSMVGISHLPIAAGVMGALEMEGIYDVVKDSSVFADGAAVYWNATGSPVGGTAGSGAATSSSAGAIFLGYAVGAKLTGDVTVRVIRQAATSAGLQQVAGTAITDPGNAGAVPVTVSGRVPIVTAGAETRTLAAPTFVGQELLIYMKTDGGDCVITCATTFSQSGSTTITLNDAGDAIRLIAVEQGANLRWRCAVNDGCVLA